MSRTVAGSDEALAYPVFVDHHDLLGAKLPARAGANLSALDGLEARHYANELALPVALDAGDADNLSRADLERHAVQSAPPAQVTHRQTHLSEVRSAALEPGRGLLTHDVASDGAEHLVPCLAQLASRHEPPRRKTLATSAYRALHRAGASRRSPLGRLRQGVAGWHRGHRPLPA